jgi:hypothetical protein
VSWHPDEPNRLAKFIMPESPEVVEVLRAAEAKAGRPLATMKPQKGAGVIYEALAEWGICYDLEPYSIGLEQKIRRHNQVLNRGLMPRGTCVDLAVLYAACLEAAHLNPLVVRMINQHLQVAHALAAFWTLPPREDYRNVHYRDPGIIRIYGSLAAAFASPTTGQAVVVDVTCLAVTDDRPAPLEFKKASSVGRGYLNGKSKQKGWEFDFALDVKIARGHGFLPFAVNQRPW